MPIVVVKVFFVPHSYRLSQFTKFQFPMKIVSRFFMLFLCLVLASACAQDEPLVPENGGNTSTPELSTRTIHMTAGTASAGDATRTTLNGANVLWDEGDQFQLVKEGPEVGKSTTLRVTLTEPNSGVGIATNTLLSHKVKYEQIKIEFEGKDITNNVTSTSTNSYNVGIINSKKNFQYAPNGSEMDAYKFNNGIVIAASSNNKVSSSNPVFITLSKVQYKNTDISWNSLEESSKNLRNGSSIKNAGLKDASYEWVHGINTPLKLTSQKGLSYGDFEGELPTGTDIDNQTFAVFPNGACSSFNDGKLTIKVPDEQYYVENSFDHHANIMIGKVNKTEGKYDATFYNMMGVFQLSLTGNDEYISSITLTNKDGNPLCGNATFDANSFINGISTSLLSGGSPSLTLTCKEDVKLTSEPTIFNFVVPVGAFEEGFEMVVTNSMGQTITKSTQKSNIVKLSTIKKMPLMDLNNFPIEDFHLHNPAVVKYMSYTDSPSFSKSVSLTRNHESELKNYLDQDCPNGYELNWTGDGSSFYVTLTDETKGKVVFENRKTDKKSYTLYNMVPNHIYKVTVATNDKIIKEGRFKAVDQVREVKISDSWNYRDLGGWTSTLGGTVKYEWLYRGGSLNGNWNQSKTTSKKTASIIANPSNYNEFTEESRNQLVDMGIKGELDLRSIPSESNNENNYAHAYALETNKTGIEDWIYKRIKTADALKYPLQYDAVVQDVDWLIDQVMRGNPIAFHCTSGADRTGAVALTILALLGVEESDIARDYELTRFSSEMGRIRKSQPTLRDRWADQGEVHDFFVNGIYTFGSDKGQNLQEKAYYYLNREFENKSNKTIPASKLDAFIKFMLDIDSYTHPSWAK